MQAAGALFGMVVTDERSALYRADPAELHVEDDAIVHRQGGRRELLMAVLARMDGPQIAVEASTKMDNKAKKEHTFHSFGVILSSA